jgi:GntR family transcriptional repressor for pyruvate dehydrogenase complex
MNQFPLIKRTRVASQAIDIIKAMILHGELAPNVRLPPERKLAVQLGVSRPSLREAIQALIALNILESRHGEGTFVSSLDPTLLAEPIDFLLHVSDDAILSLFEARCALEGSVVALAAERATDTELQDLGEFVESGRDKLNDPAAFIEHDIEFHNRIREAARSPILASMLMSVSALSYASRLRTASVPEVRSRSLKDHRAMVVTLKERNPEAARTTMLAHLEHVIDGLKPE